MLKSIKNFMFSVPNQYENSSDRLVGLKAVLPAPPSEMAHTKQVPMHKAKGLQTVSEEAHPQFVCAMQ